MQKLFLACLNDLNLSQLLLIDFTATLSNFTDNEAEASKYAKGTIDRFKSSLNNPEQVVRKYLSEIPNYHEKFKELNVKRAEIISKQILEELEIKIGVKVLDFGCGNGLVGSQVAITGIDITGSDVVNYLAESTNLNFLEFKKYTIPVTDLFFTQGWANSVIHHDPNPELVVKEISRVVKSRFVLIEDILRADLPGGIDFHRERMFANDYFYNRLLTFEDIPVPGSFMLKEEWIELFKNNGWFLKSELDLGSAIILKAVYRYKLVFER